MNKLFKVLLGLSLIGMLSGCGGKKIDRELIASEQGDLVVVNAEEVLSMIEDDKTFVFVVTQTQCSHCQQYEPRLLEVAVEENILVYQIIADKDTSSDSEALTELMESLELEYTPTTYMIVEGEVEDSFVGSITNEEITKYFKEQGVIVK